MASFTLETPAPRVREDRKDTDAKVIDALAFGSDKPNEWFVFDAETLPDGFDKDDVRKTRARVNQRVGRLRKAGKDRGLTVEITVRKDERDVKGYARVVTEQA